MNTPDTPVIIDDTPDPREVAALVALANRRRLQDRERLSRQGRETLRRASRET